MASNLKRPRDDDGDISRLPPDNSDGKPNESGDCPTIVPVQIDTSSTKKRESKYDKKVEEQTPRSSSEQVKAHKIVDKKEPRPANFPFRIIFRGEPTRFAGYGKNFGPETPRQLPFCYMFEPTED
jgi:hypothetical protein